MHSARKPAGVASPRKAKAEADKPAADASKELLRSVPSERPMPCLRHSPAATWALINSATD